MAIFVFVILTACGSLAAKNPGSEDKVTDKSGSELSGSRSSSTSVHGGESANSEVTAVVTSLPRLTTAPTTTSAVPPVTLDELRNMTLPEHTCALDGRTTNELVGGTTPPAENGAAMHLNETSIVFDDFDGDGGTDAAFVLDCNANFTGALSGDALVRFAAGPTIRLNGDSLLADPSLPTGAAFAGSHSLRSNGDQLTVGWTAFTDDDAPCCPTLAGESTGTVSRDGFVSVAAVLVPTEDSPPASPGGGGNAGEWPSNGDWFGAPRLGSEPVRGSGCGADGSIGATIPDGWWVGVVRSLDATSMSFDLVCAYFGEAAQPFLDKCAAELSYEECVSNWGLDFYPVNNNERTRTVPVAPNVERQFSRPEIDERTLVEQQAVLTWIHIVNGQATHIYYGYPGG